MQPLSGLCAPKQIASRHSRKSQSVPSFADSEQRWDRNWLGRTPAKPPQELRKSPVSNSFTSGVDGEWSDATMSTLPSCAAAPMPMRQQVLSHIPL
jgi:hypothetical protein